ncbi:hypothetical protein B0T12DRAFT_207126 [Alternaria alternata]|nr:hypothetical protein B0T12DRAFT_207126 [Alternaria alternata]
MFLSAAETAAITLHDEFIVLLLACTVSSTTSLHGQTDIPHVCHKGLYSLPSVPQSRLMQLSINYFPVFDMSWL